jgi:ligand-binding sensor domain-containing protein
MRVKLILFLWLVLCKGVLFSQSLSFQVYNSINSALPNNNITNIEFSPNGDWWVGNLAGGITRYNGSQWETTTNMNNAPEEEEILWRSSLLYANNSIWAVTTQPNYSGVYLYKYNGTIWSSWDVMDLTGSYDPDVNYYHYGLDISGSNIWIAGYQGLIKFNTTSNTAIVEIAEGNGSINSVVKTDGSDIWLGSIFGAYLFDGLSLFDYTWLNTPMDDNCGDLSDIHIDTNGDVWFATDRGLYKRSSNTGNWKEFNSLNSGLPSGIIWCIEEYNDKLWIGTNEGMAIFDGHTNWVVYDESNSDLPSNVINEIEFNNNKIYICTNNGLAVSSLNLTIDNDLNNGNKDISWFVLEDKILIDFEDAKDILKYSIYSMDGACLVFSSNFSNNSIPIESLKKGNYIIKLETNTEKNQIYTIKFVKDK